MDQVGADEARAMTSGRATSIRRSAWRNTQLVDRSVPGLDVPMEPPSARTDAVSGSTPRAHLPRNQRAASTPSAPPLPAIATPRARLDFDGLAGPDSARRRGQRSRRLPPHLAAETAERLAREAAKAAAEAAAPAPRTAAERAAYNADLVSPQWQDALRAGRKLGVMPTEHAAADSNSRRKHSLAVKKARDELDAVDPGMFATLDEVPSATDYSASTQEWEGYNPARARLDSRDAHGAHAHRLHVAVRRFTLMFARAIAEGTPIHMCHQRRTDRERNHIATTLLPYFS